jgi:hypothetical protein
MVFIRWRLRFVGVRPSKVSGLSVLACDPRATALQPNIDAFTNAGLQLRSSSPAWQGGS